MAKTPDVKGNHMIITLAISGASINKIASEMQLAYRAVIARIRRNPEVVAIELEKLEPEKYEKICSQLNAGTHPNKVAAFNNLVPPIIYAMRDYLDVSTSSR